jgi:hypothetical protein
VATFVKVFDAGLTDSIDDLRAHVRYYGVMEEDLDVDRISTSSAMRSWEYAHSIRNVQLRPILVLQCSIHIQNYTVSLARLSSTQFETESHTLQF